MGSTASRTSQNYPGARRSNNGVPISSMPLSNSHPGGSVPPPRMGSDRIPHSHNRHNAGGTSSNGYSNTPLRTSNNTGISSSSSNNRQNNMNTSRTPGMTGPGAFLVEPIPPNSSHNQTGTIFRVGVPQGVAPGEEFQVYAGSRVVRVRCPPNARPGHFLQITVPPDPSVSQLSRASLTSAGGRGLPAPNSETQDNYTTPGVMLDGQPTSQGQGYLVPIPTSVKGNKFPIFISGQQLLVTIPPNAQEGMLVRIYAPVLPPNSGISAPALNQTQMFEAVVPPGVAPNQPFALLAGGQRVLVTCPSNAKPGQRIRFQLPMALLQQPNQANSQSTPSLEYEKHGWARTIRISDFKFQWVRMEHKSGAVNLSTSFDPHRSAYVRQLDFFPGKDFRMRTGLLRLISASQAVTDSSIKDENNPRHEIVSYAELTNIQMKSFNDKASWFFNVCRARLGVDWNSGHVRINVRRDYLVEDSMQAILSLSRKDLRRTFRFEFIGESGVDAGGLAREWFELVTKEVFNPDRGLWVASMTNQMCMQINPSSGLADPEEHLAYFRFLGRVLGKALFDQQLVSYHMVRYMYKHLLGWPTTFDDLAAVDTEYHANLLKIWDLSADDLSLMCLDFTTTEKGFGNIENIDLVPNGSKMEVTKENLPDYLEACYKFRLMGQVQPQLTELLLGFFDIIPEPLLTIFDFQELELLMCGVPEINVQDWKANTDYSGSARKSDMFIGWFWDVVENDLDREMKARLLQFSTGTSGVPSRGFSYLQGNDGNLRKFTIHGVSLNSGIYPRAHTCFNRIDLPVYKSKKQLKDNLIMAIQLEATGFGLE